MRFSTNEERRHRVECIVRTWHHKVNGLIDGFQSDTATPPLYHLPRLIISGDRGSRSFPAIGEICGLAFLEDIQDIYWRWPVRILVNQYASEYDFSCEISIKSSRGTRRWKEVIAECKNEDDVSLAMQGALDAFFDISTKSDPVQVNDTDTKSPDLLDAVRNSHRWPENAKQRRHPNVEIFLEITKATLLPLDICVLHGITTDIDHLSRLCDFYSTDGVLVILMHSETMPLAADRSLVALRYHNRKSCIGLLTGDPALRSANESVTNILLDVNDSHCLLRYGWHSKGSEKDKLSSLRLRAALQHINATMEWVHTLIQWWWRHSRSHETVPLSPEFYGFKKILLGLQREIKTQKRIIEGQIQLSADREAYEYIVGSQKHLLALD